MGVQAVEGKSASGHFERVRADQASRQSRSMQAKPASCHRYDTSVLVVVVVSSILDALNESFAVDSQVIIARVFLAVYTCEMVFRSSRHPPSTGWVRCNAATQLAATRQRSSLQRGNAATRQRCNAATLDWFATTRCP